MKFFPRWLLVVLACGPGLLPALPYTTGRDRGLEAALRTTYNYRIVLDGQVTVSVSHGVVTLTGTVQDDEELALATDTAQTLPGTDTIENRLVIQPRHPEGSDDWISLHLRRRMLTNAHVGIARTVVTVRDGIVTFAGTAGSAAQRALTIRLADGLTGVVAVHDELAIRPAPAGAAEIIDDTSITTQVRRALSAHSAPPAFQPRVSTRDGIVQLSGTIGSEAEKTIVTQLVRDVRGTRSVINALLVRG